MPRGRKPTPKIVVSLQGTPDKPEYLDPVASAEWDRLVDLLEHTGNLSTVDGAALAIYCVAFANWRQCQERIAKEGMTIVARNGQPAMSPTASLALQLEKQMLTILNQFGLTPRSRKAVKQEDKRPVENKDHWADFDAKYGKAV